MCPNVRKAADALFSFKPLRFLQMRSRWLQGIADQPLIDQGYAFKVICLEPALALWTQDLAPAAEAAAYRDPALAVAAGHFAHDGAKHEQGPWLAFRAKIAFEQDRIIKRELAKERIVFFQIKPHTGGRELRELAVLVLKRAPDLLRNMLCVAPFH